MQSQRSDEYVIVIEGDDNNTTEFVEWLCMKQSMELLLPNISPSLRNVLGSIIHTFMITTTVFSGVLFGYILFPKMIYPSGTDKDTEEDLLTYKNWYIMTSTFIALVIVVFEEAFSFLIQSRFEERLTKIEEYIQYLNDSDEEDSDDDSEEDFHEAVEEPTSDQEVQVDLAQTVNPLIEDIKLLNSKFDRNFKIVFDHLGIKTPPTDKELESIAIPIEESLIPYSAPVVELRKRRTYIHETGSN